MTDPKAPSQEIVARSAREIENLPDEDLLGTDYKAWLKRRRAEAAETLGTGETARTRAERAMAKAEETMKRAKDFLDD